MRPAETVRELYRRLDVGDPLGARALLAPEFSLSSTVHPAPMDADAWLAALSHFDAAFSEISHGVVIDEEQGALVRGRFHVSGWHTGTLAFPGEPVLPATGKRFQLPAEPFVAEVRDGRVLRIEVTMADENGGYKAVLAQLRGEAEPAPAPSELGR